MLAKTDFKSFPASLLLYTCLIFLFGDVTEPSRSGDDLPLEIGKRKITNLEMVGIVSSIKLSVLLHADGGVLCARAGGYPVRAL